MRILLVTLMLSALLMGCSKTVASVPETSQTMASWHEARKYQGEGRHELAKQYYQMALATARTPAAQKALIQEIETADRILQTIR